MIYRWILFTGFLFFFNRKYGELELGDFSVVGQWKICCYEFNHMIWKSTLCDMAAHAVQALRKTHFLYICVLHDNRTEF